MITDVPPRAELSRPLDPDAVGSEPTIRVIEAEAGERAALARRLDLLSLDLLRARLQIRRLEDLGILSVEGSFEAEATQACVVTLEPVTCRLAEPVEWRYSLASNGAAGDLESPSGQRDVWIETDAVDPPEPIGLEGVDLGEALAQQLSLALDPFPRAEGASVEHLDWPGKGRSDPVDGPFAALESLRRKG